MVISNRSLSYRFGSSLFYGIIITYPHLFIINIFWQHTLSFGKNAYIFFITVTIVACFFLQWKKILFRFKSAAAFLFVLTIVLVVYVRLLTNLGVNIIDFRMGIMILIYCGIAYAYTRGSTRKNIVGKIILANCVIHALIGIIHYYFFPNILTGVEGSKQLYLISDFGQAERGILVSPNLYSNFILLGLFQLVKRERTWKIPKLFEIVFFIIIMWGTVISNSRFATGMSIFLFILYLKESNISNRFILILAAAGTAYYLCDNYQPVLSAIMSENIGLRAEKWAVGLQIIGASIANMFLGSPLSDYTIGGVHFSDNSYITLSLFFGIPVTILLFSSLVVFLKRTIVLKQNKLPLLYFALCLFLYGSIAFDVWLFYYFVAIYTIQPENKEIAARYRSYAFR